MVRIPPRFDLTFHTMLLSLNRRKCEVVFDSASPEKHAAADHYTAGYRLES